MIKHIVMWKIVDHYQNMEKEQLLQEMRKKLLALPQHISEIIQFDVDINIVSSAAHFDISLFSTFHSIDTLTAYQLHPKHIEVAQFIQAIASERTVIDAEF